MSAPIVRDFSNIGDAIEIPNLIEIQQSSYSRFLQEDVAPAQRKNQGLESLFKEIFPIESYDKTMQLDYLFYELEKARYTPQECRQLRLTYGYPIKITCRLRKKTGEDMAEQSIYLGEMPKMIGGGEFIINGAERVIVNQLHRSPGVDFLIESKEGDRVLHGGRIIPERGSWIEISVTKKDVLVVRIDQSSKIPATTFLRAMDEKYGTTESIIRLFYPTKNVPVGKLDPSMWAVGPVVDTETGEVIVEAGTMIGDRVGVLQGRPISTSSAITQGDVSQYILDELEFKYVPTPDIEADETKLKSFLEFIENRLMLDYADEEKPDKSKRHIPKFNRENAKGNNDADDKEKIKKFLEKWDQEASPELKDILAACKKKIEDKTPWFTHPDEIDDLAFKKPGLYFFRNKNTKLVKYGYIGIAGERQGKGLSDRMKGSHYASNPDDSLRKSVKEYLEAQSETKSIATQARSGGLKTLEVIEKVTDALVLNTIAEDDCENHEQALLKLYARLRPGNPPQIDKAKTLFNEKFYDINRYRLGRVGRFRLNRKFNLNIDENEMTLRPEDFLNTIRYIVGMRNGEGVIDDIDHLGNRRLRTIDELAADEVRKGLLKLRRTVQERMSMKDPEALLRIADLVNSKSVSSSIDYFFGRGELSQVVDQTNALSMLTHERRLSALGPGGLNRKRAGFEVRDVHISHYGRICPIETPEGTNIGLIASLSIFSAIDDYGFLITPYRKVEKGKVTGEAAYLRADEEMEAVFAPPSVIDKDKQKLKPGTVLARKKGELAQVDSSEIDYVDISPKQVVGVSAALIPFLEHDDANRALMGSNMQRQAVPLLKTEAPLVGTGMERYVAQNSSMVVLARKSGTITAVDATHIVIDDTDEYELEKFIGLNERTCLNQRPIVKLGEKVKKNQIIADGGGTAEGELALGKNVLVAFVPFDGYNFEDAILISEKLVRNDAFTSIHIDEFSVEVRETKLGREEFTRDIPNVSEKALRNLDESGVVREGTRVAPGDILVGKVSPKSKTELTPEEKLLHAIFGRAGEDVKNDSLEVPSGYEGVVIQTKRFMRRGAGSEDQQKAQKAEMKKYEAEMKAKECKVFKQMVDAILEKLEVTIIDPSTRQKVGASEDMDVIYEQIENFSIAWVKPANMRDDVQKMIDKYWPKILEIQEERKRKVERLKHGDELPSGVLEMVKVYVATKRALSIGDKMAGRHGNKGVIARIMPEEDMPFLEDGTSVEILLNPLGVPSRMNVGQILETHLGWVAKVLGFNAYTPVFDGADEDQIKQLTAEGNEHVAKRQTELAAKKQVPPVDELFVNVPLTLKTKIYDGRTGEPFEQMATIGYIYMMKLHHLVDDKIHARATGPYSLITQQPLGGKARTGGQRFGEMEVWALEGYGAAYTLQELLTVKSDDIEGRTKIYESMVKGENTLEAGTPISFDVLCNEIRGLGLNIQLEKKRLGSTPI